MPARTTDMARGDPTKLILRFSLPLLVSTLLQPLYHPADTFVAGRAEAPAAASSASRLA